MAQIGDRQSDAAVEQGSGPDCRTDGAGQKPVITADFAKEIASCLNVDDPAKVEHLTGRMQRYANGYFAAHQGLRIRLTPGGTRTFMRSVAGHIGRLQSDLAKLEKIDQVVARYADAAAGNPQAQPSLIELGWQLEFLRQTTQEMIQAPPPNVRQKGGSKLDHAVGSFMALFEALNGERAKAASQRDGAAGEFLMGPSGLAICKVFEAIDPHLSEAALAASVRRLTTQFEGREMLERDFDWISAIEDDGSFDVSIGSQA